VAAVAAAAPYALPPHLAPTQARLCARLGVLPGAPPGPAGAAPARSILLSGPAGAGKARLAASFARQSGAVLLSVSGRDLLGRYSEPGPALLASIFAVARRQASAAVVVISGLEELVAPAGPAGGGGPGAEAAEAEHAAAVLCAELEQQLRELNAPGAAAPAVAVLGITSAAARLPDSMCRAFGVTVHVPLPVA
jgi:SpoVK/Ycf46/Vps4 family AAA+-type ATPase